MASSYAIVLRSPKRSTHAFSGWILTYVSVDISGQKLNNGDEYRNLKFQLYRWKATAMESVLWGEFEMNGNEILEGGEKVKSIGNKSGSDISARLNQGQG